MALLSLAVMGGYAALTITLAMRAFKRSSLRSRAARERALRPLGKVVIAHP